MPPGTVLVADGQPTAAIIWWRNGTSPVPPFAASEIQAYLQKISGVTLPIREGVVDSPASPTSGIVIATGAAAGAAEQDPITLSSEWLTLVGPPLQAVQGDGFAIRTMGEQVILAGTNERSILYATYRFLEHLGVRFFAPAFPFYDGQAEHVPAKASIQISALDIQEAASFKHRRKYVEEGWSHTPQTVTQLLDWMVKQRLNVLVYPYDYEALGIVTWDSWRAQLIPELAKRGIVLQVGGHGYHSFLPPGRYQAAHPDWFPDPDDPVAAERSPGPANVFHVGNEKALQAYIDNVIAYLQARPEIGIFEAWPPDEAKWPSSVVEQFGSIANAEAHVIRALSAALRQAIPEVTVEVIAYIPATDPPDRELMYDDSTIVDIAPFDRSYAEPLFESDHPRNRYYNQLLKKWQDGGFRGDMGVYEYYRKYSWHSLPVILPRLIGDEIPYYLSQGANGLGIYSEPADWLTYELTHSLVAALSWDAGLRADDYVDTYLKDRFGAAAEEMGAYVTLMEEAGRLLFDRVRGNYDSPEVVTKVREHYLRAKEFLAAAREKVDDQGSPALVTERLGWNLDFAIADTEVDYYRLRREPEKMTEARQRARALADAHGFDGIILQCTALARRYDPRVTRVETLSIYDRYRDAW
jgi:hypothetical protein